VPKGDRAILKADIEDGYTQIANLLLEAIAIAPLSGVEKGLLLAMCRLTYGWANGDKGQRRTEATVSSLDLATILNTHKVSTARSLKKLVTANILIAKDLGKGKGFTYGINTRISQWADCKLNGLQSAEWFIPPSTKRLTVLSTKRLTPAKLNHEGEINNKEIIKKVSIENDKSFLSPGDFVQGGVKANETA